MIVFVLFLLPSLLTILAGVLACMGYPYQAAIVAKTAALTWVILFALATWGWIRRRNGAANEIDSPY